MIVQLTALQVQGQAAQAVQVAAAAHRRTPQRNVTVMIAAPQAQVAVLARHRLPLLLLRLQVGVLRIVRSFLILYTRKRVQVRVRVQVLVQAQVQVLPRPLLPPQVMDVVVEKQSYLMIFIVKRILRHQAAVAVHLPRVQAAVTVDVERIRIRRIASYSTIYSIRNQTVLPPAVHHLLAHPQAAVVAVAVARRNHLPQADVDVVERIKV